MSFIKNFTMTCKRIVNELKSQMKLAKTDSRVQAVQVVFHPFIISRLDLKFFLC